MARFQRKPLITFNADDVWAAACAAQRINGAYIKFKQPGDKLETNREVVDRLIGNPTEFIKDEDRAMGQKVRQYYQAFTFKVLQGLKLSFFDDSAMRLAEKELVSGNYDLAVITSLPASYGRSVKKDDVNSRINFAQGGHVGPVGTKLVLDVEVLRCNYSQLHNIFFVTGVTTEDSVVFFAYKAEIAAGRKISIGGTVKAHRENQTQLNRVKVL